MSENVEAQDNTKIPDAEKETINQIYDKILKRILMLSQGAVINLINALFNMHFPLDSEIVYNLTENIGDELGRTLSDTIITLQRHEFPSASNLVLR